MRFVADAAARWLAFFLVVSSSWAACSEGRTNGSVLLRLRNATDVSRAPEDVRVFVYDDAGPLFEDERLPGNGRLVPESDDWLGSVVLYVGEISGAVTVDVFGTLDGERISQGSVRVLPDPARQVSAVVELSAPEAWARGDGPLGRHEDGGRCTSDAQCLGGHCLDGVCCQVASCGGCQSCAVAGKEGRCADLPALVEDREPKDLCSGRLACDGLGACRQALGQPCGADADCASNHCADGVCCASACDGTCQRCDQAESLGRCAAVPAGLDPGGHCGAGRTCDGRGACNAGCTSDAQCGTSERCVRSATGDGVCRPLRKAGEDCAVDVECASGSCKGGVCCAQSCGLCQTCSGPGGSCTPVPRGSPDDDEGTGSCIGRRACDGGGVCRKRNGETCAGDGDCASGFCVEGLCCESSCQGPCRRCGAGGLCQTITNASDPRTCSGNNVCDGAGRCRRKQGERCTSHAECATGHCVDGVCCNSACDVSCFACQTGTCTIVVNGEDPQCGTARRCDGQGTCRPR